MAWKLAELFVEFTADTSDVDKGIDRVKNNVTAAAKAIDGAARGVKSLMRAGALGVGYRLGQEALQQYITQLEAAKKLSEETGRSLEDVSKGAFTNEDLTRLNNYKKAMEGLASIAAAAGRPIAAGIGSGGVMAEAFSRGVTTEQVESERKFAMEAEAAQAEQQRQAHEAYQETMQDMAEIEKEKERAAERQKAIDADLADHRALKQFEREYELENAYMFSKNASGGGYRYDREDARRNLPGMSESGQQKMLAEYRAFQDAASRPDEDPMRVANKWERMQADLMQGLAEDMAPAIAEAFQQSPPRFQGLEDFAREMQLKALGGPDAKKLQEDGNKKLDAANGHLQAIEQKIGGGGGGGGGMGGLRFV